MITCSIKELKGLLKLLKEFLSINLKQSHSSLGGFLMIWGTLT